MHQRIVFSDFDGTISASETFTRMLDRFTPELAAELVPALVAQRLTLREGVRRLVESIPSACYGAILEHVREVGLRPGLPELLDFLDARGVPFIVVSAGLRGMVEAALGDLRARVHAVYAMDAETAGPFLRVQSAFEEGDELVAKVAVMRCHPARETVALGDSVTDLQMALAASTVFARDRLCGYLDRKSHTYLRWEDFHDVRQALAERWG
ncbi:MAG: HAD-IB family phosphatase [Proteobacteria bacterium]|nr:HAD-IB family phosphatase [Pseudomonadota bacterium]